MKKIDFLQSCFEGWGVSVMSMHVLSDSKVFVLKEIGLKKAFGQIAECTLQ